MTRYGSRVLTVTAAQAGSGASLLSGPLRLKGWSLNDGAANQELSARGTANAPGAGATVASISLPTGEYTVAWELELTGTPGAGDVDNVALFIGATQIAISDNLGAVGDYPQTPVDAIVVAGPLTLAAKAIGAAVVGSVYTVNLTIDPTTPSQATISDGSQAVAFINVEQGDVSNMHLGDEGIQIRNAVKVLTTQGVISGVLWYDVVDVTEHHWGTAATEGP